MFPKPPKLGRTSTPSIFPLAVLPPCHSYLAAGSRLRWNVARQWCAWSRWDPGTWETDPAPGCAVRMRRWWEMCRLVFFSWIQLIKLWVCSETCHWLLPPLWQRLPRRPVRSSTTRSASLPLPLSAHLQRVHVPAWSGCRVSNLNPEKLQIFDACQMVIFLRWFIMDIFLPVMVIYHGRKDQKSPLTNLSIHFHEDWYCLLGEDIGRQNLSKKNGRRLSVAIRGFRGSLKMRVGLSSLEGNLWIHDLTSITTSTAAEVLYKPKRARLLPSPTPFAGQLEVDPPKESRFGRRATLSEESKSSTRKRTCSASCITASMSLEVFFWSWGFNVAERSMMAAERQSK